MTANDPFTGIDMTQKFDASLAAEKLGVILNHWMSGGDAFTAGVNTGTAPATPTIGSASPTGDVAIPQGSDAVGLANPDVSQGYGGGTGHPGIDLSVPVGTPLLAAESGTVTGAGNTDPGGYGNEVEITAADGTVMRYGHLSGVSVAVGDTVKRGALIGKSGGEAGAEGAGNSTGPHLHFEVRDSSGNTVDPVPYLAGNTGGIVKGSATTNPAVAHASASYTADTTSTDPFTAGVTTPSTTPTQSADGTSTVQANGSTSDSDPAAVDTFLAATRQHESGGDYTVYNQSGQSNASGAYQFLGSTWKGMGGSTDAAAQASPAEQDAIARKMAMQLFDQFHSWRLVAIAWYGGPAVAQQVANGTDPGSPQGQGGYLAYGDTIVSMMSGGK